jgi:hypothetical protein
MIAKVKMGRQSAIADRCTGKKEYQIFLILYKDIQNGAVAKSFMRKGFLIYEEMPLVIFDFATAPFRISVYMRKN